jgi:segregation and condensation protein B
MSSRKRKRDKRPGEAEGVAAPDAQAGESDLADDAQEESDEPKQAEAESSDEADLQAEAPAVSEISELKPRNKRKRVAAEESEANEDVSESDAEEDADEETFGNDTAKEAPKTRAQLKRVIESLIFVSDQVISAQQLGRIAKTKVAEVREMLAEIAIDFEGRGVELVEVNGGYQFRSAAASAAYVRVLVAQKPVRLTRAQLETLALIAYRQPITRPEVDDVRGVDSGSAIKVLLDRDLIKILGRKEDAGRPLLYGTTPFFLEFFGMNTMQELPTLREFTELSDEHRELFQRKTNEIGDLSAEAEQPISVPGEGEGQSDSESDDAEMAELEPGDALAAEAQAERIDEAHVEADEAEDREAVASEHTDDGPDTRAESESDSAASWEEPDEGTSA